jgi:hypothetical protein
MGLDMFSDYLFCIEEDILIVRVVEGVAVGGVQPAAAQREGLARCLQQLTLLTEINSLFTERRQQSLPLWPIRILFLEHFLSLLRLALMPHSFLNFTRRFFLQLGLRTTSSVRNFFLA